MYLGKKKLKSIEKIMRLQSDYVFNDYTHGMVNGMILMESILFDKEPKHYSVVLKYGKWIYTRDK
jgi:hypothetical protein